MAFLTVQDCKFNDDIRNLACVHRHTSEKMNIPPPTMHNTQSLSQSCHTVLLIRPLQFFLPSLNLIFRNLPEHLPLPKTIEVFRAVIVSILLLTSVRYPAKYYKCTQLNKYDNASTVLYLLSICRK